MTTRFVRVNRSRVCPICGGLDKCRVSPSFENSEVVACTRIQSGSFKSSNNTAGIEEHYHKLKNADTNRPPHRPRPPSTSNPTPTADVHLRNGVYSRLVELLGLSINDRQDNEKRGLDPSKLGYATIPKGNQRGQTIAALIEEFGFRQLRTIPGFIELTNDGERPPLHIHAGPGLLVPCRNRDGKIIAVRRRDPNPKAAANKWVYLSGGRHSDGSAGASVGTPLHWAKQPKGSLVVVVEGERKSDVAAAHLGKMKPELLECGIVSIPGVGSWQAAGLIGELVRAECKTVLIAFDADQWKNHAVGSALLRMAAALDEADFVVEFLSWEAGAKGIDDALLANLAIQAIGAPESLKYRADLAKAHDLDLKGIRQVRVQTRRNDPSDPTVEDDRPRVNTADPEECTLTKALEVLAEDPILFLKNGRIVVPVSSQGNDKDNPFAAYGEVRLMAASPQAIAARLAVSIHFYDIKPGTEIERTKGCPRWLSERVAAVAGSVGYAGGPRNIVGLLPGPTIDQAGMLVNAAGYCKIDGRGWYLPSLVQGLSIPDLPTIDDCKKAERKIWSAVRFFEWRDELDYPKWLCALFAIILRPLFSTCPFFITTARSPGNGKTYLILGAGLIAHGVEPHLATWPSDERGREDELRKRLVGLINRGQILAPIDNAPDGSDIVSPVLCAFLTSPSFADRQLGMNTGDQVGGLNWLVLMLSGNNVSPAGDLAERTLMINLETQSLNPRERSPSEFGEIGDFLAYCKDPTNQKELLEAVLTIARGYHQEGRPKQPGSNWGSFSDFVRVVVDPVRWITGIDPLADRTKVLADDPKQAALTAIMCAWKNLLGVEDWFSAGEVLSKIAPDQQNPDAVTLRENLAEFGKAGTVQGLGKVLACCLGRRKSIEGQILAFTKKDNSHTKSGRFRLQEYSQAPNGANWAKQGRLPPNNPAVIAGNCGELCTLTRSEKQGTELIGMPPKEQTGKITANTANTAPSPDLGQIECDPEFHRLNERIDSWDKIERMAVEGLA